MRYFRFALAACTGLLLAASMPARAVEPAPGSKNFEPPGAVPNYFSNEAGPFRGGAGAETTYSSPGGNSGPAVVSPYPPRRTAAAAPRRSAGRHAARGKSRTRLAHAHARSGRYAARTRTAKAKSAVLRTAHAHAKPAASKLKTTAAKRTAASKAAAAKRPASAKSRPAARRVAHTASR